MRTGYRNKRNWRDQKRKPQSILREEGKVTSAYYKPLRGVNPYVFLKQKGRLAKPLQVVVVVLGTHGKMPKQNLKVHYARCIFEKKTEIRRQNQMSEGRG